MKDQKTTIFLILLALFIGGLFGSRLDRKLVHKDLETQRIITPSIPGQAVQRKGSSYYFVLPEIKNNNQITSEKITELEAILSTKNYKMAVLVKQRQSAKLPFKPETGILDAAKLVDLNSVDEIFLPIYEASPLEDSECSSEIQYATLKNSPINSIDDLKDKNVAIGQPGIPLAFLSFKELVAKNIKFKSIVIANSHTDILSTLNSGKVDAMILRTRNFSNGIINGVFGTTSQNIYPDFPDIKIIYTTNYNIPCNIIFVNNFLEKNIKAEISERYMELFHHPNYKQVMRENLGLASIKRISKDEWQTIAAKLKNLFRFDLNSVADKIVKEE